MKIKAYFRGKNTDLITVEINGHKIKDIPLETALNKYYDCDSVIDKIEECCLRGNKNSIDIWNDNKEWIYEAREIRRELENEEEPKRGHGDQHKSLEEILGSIEDNNIRQQIQQIIQQYENEFGEKMEYLAEGQESTVFSIGDKVIKFGSIPTQEGAPLTLEPFERIQYEKNSVMRVLQKAEVGNVEREDLQQFYNKMRNLGYVWYDIKHDNVGWIQENGKKELRVIDDIDVLSEENVLNGIPGKTKAYSSVLEFMQACDDQGALYEIQYQMTHNPKFNIKDLGKYFHRCDYDQATQITVSKLQIKFEEWSKEQVTGQKQDKKQVVDKKTTETVQPKEEVQEEPQATTDDIKTSKDNIPKDKVERLRLAIAEIGLDQERVLQMIEEPVLSWSDEEYEKAEGPFDKYDIYEIARLSKEEIQLIISKLRGIQEKNTQLEELPSSEIEETEASSTKTHISQENVELLRMAIQDARQQGMDAETIKKYIYPYQTVRGWKMEESEKWAKISAKYGINKIMGEDYMSKDKGYRGSSFEMRDMIDNLTQEEIQKMEEEQIAIIENSRSDEEPVSLTEIGKKSYQHFGIKIAEKLKETVGALKSKFLSKDKDRNEDFTNGR